MAKVIVVNIDKMVDDHVNPKFESEGFSYVPSEHTIAIIVAPNGFIVVENDGAHYTYTSKENKFEIDLFKRVGTGTEMIPTAQLTPTISELLETPEIERTEAELTDCVRHFGQRIEHNYAILLDTIREMGLDPDDYPRAG